MPRLHEWTAVTATARRSRGAPGRITVLPGGVRFPNAQAAKASWKDNCYILKGRRLLEIPAGRNPSESDSPWVAAGPFKFGRARRAGMRGSSWLGRGWY